MTEDFHATTLFRMGEFWWLKHLLRDADYSVPQMARPSRKKTLQREKLKRVLAEKRGRDPNSAFGENFSACQLCDP